MMGVTRLHTAAKTECTHCGLECGKEAISLREKSFCCRGCKTVFELLTEHDLGHYYRIEVAPGISQKPHASAFSFAFLDDETTQKQLADFETDTQYTITVSLPEIHCPSCIWLLENLHRINSGIAGSTVHFTKKTATYILHKDKISLRQLAELLKSIGYTPQFSLESLEAASGNHPNRSLWLKLGVAGFAFGNTMLFSFPEYLVDAQTDVEHTMKWVFGGLNILLAIPVLLFSSADYLRSGWAAIRHASINLDVPISMGILALFFWSLFEIISGTGTGYMDSFTGLIFFLLIGKLLQQKTFEHLSFERNFKAYLPISVNILDDEQQEESVPLHSLKTGQRILLRKGEILPADGLVFSKEGCMMDYSFITGESEPVFLAFGEKVFAGGKLLSNSTVLSVLKEPSSSYLTQLWNDSSEQKKTPVSSFAERISPYFTIAVIAVAVGAWLYWMWFDFEKALFVFASVLIVACPCALALSSPFSMSAAVNILSRSGLFVKNPILIERLSEINTVIFDKTGTLTKADSTRVEYTGTAICETDKCRLAFIASESKHPFAKSLFAALKAEPSNSGFIKTEEYASGISSWFCDSEIHVGTPSFLKSLGYTISGISPKNDTLSTILHLGIDGKYAGYFMMSQTLRTGLEEISGNMSGIADTYVLSGDNDTYLRVLSRYFDKKSILFNQSPFQKKEFVESLQKKGKRVVMIGDGLNDAGALRSGDFGIALTDEPGSFSPASDAIMSGNSLAGVPSFLRFAKQAVRTVLYSFGLSLCYNLVGIGFAVSGNLSPLVAAVLMPLSSISIMIFTTARVHWSAQKLGLAWK